MGYSGAMPGTVPPNWLRRDDVPLHCPASLYRSAADAVPGGRAAAAPTSEAALSPGAVPPNWLRGPDSESACAEQPPRTTARPTISKRRLCDDERTKTPPF